MTKGAKTGGRKKGTPNKVGHRARTNFALAFEEMGALDALVKWARENPTDFYKLYARLLPTEVEATVEAAHKVVFRSGDKTLEIAPTTDHT